MVDVIVVNFNGRHHLETCLPELARQTYTPNQVIVVENGSTDDSLQWLIRVHPWVHVVELKSNRGFTGGNIAGVQASTAEYVVLLNNDTLPDPNWLEELVLAADHHPEAGIVASVMLRWGTEIVDTAGDGCTWAGTGYKAATGLHYGQIQDGYVFGACAGAALYRRKMLDEIGFLDPDFFLNQEDADISFRAQLAGWKVWLASKSRVQHRVSATSGKLSPVVVYHGSKNTEAIFWKNMPAGLLIRALPHRIVQTIGSFITIGIKHKQMKPFLLGKLAAVKNFPIILEKRRQIQRLRRMPNSYLKELFTPVCSVSYLFKRKRIRAEYHKISKSTSEIITYTSD